MTFKRKTVLVVFLFLILAMFLITFYAMPKIAKKIYRKPFYDIVSMNAQDTGLDEHFIYAVIYTESKFDSDAVSDAQARGLMQIIEDAFEWIKYKKNDDTEISFDHMFMPKYNIEYGSFYLKYLYDKYGDYRVAIAAYHAGMSKVDGWLQDIEVSDDGVTIEVFPSSVTNHYVNKVMNAWTQYNRIYND